MILKINKSVFNFKSFKDGLMEMPFVLDVKRFNGSIIAVTLYEGSSDIESDKVYSYADNFENEYCYTYEKQLNPEILKEALDYRLSFISKILKRTYLNGVVTIVSSSQLDEQEQQELESLVLSIDETYDLAVRKDIQQNVMSRARAFGMEFLDVFTSNNVYLEKTDEQINSLLTNYPQILTCCLTGSIRSLQAIVYSMQPNEDISSDELNEFKKRIDYFFESQ